MSKKTIEGKLRMEEFIQVYLPEIEKIYEVKKYEHHFKICVSKTLSFDYYPKGRKIGKISSGKATTKYRTIEPDILLNELYKIQSK